MALYDAKERRKVSENFYFDMNSDTVKRMLSSASHLKPADITSLARTCVFDVSSAATGSHVQAVIDKFSPGPLF